MPEPGPAPPLPGFGPCPGHIFFVSRGGVVSARSRGDSMRQGVWMAHQCRLPPRGSEITGLTPNFVVGLHSQNMEERLLVVQPNDGDASPTSLPGGMAEGGPRSCPHPDVPASFHRTRRLHPRRLCQVENA